MDAADVTAITAAFDVSDLFDTFLLFAPYIMIVLGVVIGVGLVKWAIRTVRGRLSGGL